MIKNLKFSFVYFIIFFVVFACTHQRKTPLQKPTIPIQKYSRTDWAHWSDKDEDCQNTRHEILIARSLVPPVLDRRKCRVISGKWADYYFPEVHLKAKAVDIDHLIPLKHAHDVGGHAWTNDEKENFANDVENLVITRRSYNRQKGAKRIDQWLPVHKEYACKYIKDWIRLKEKYKLNFTSPEKRTIELSRCH